MFPIRAALRPMMCVLVSSLLSLSGLAQERRTAAIPGAGPIFGSPAAGEIDGDSTRGAEVAVTGADGLLHAFAGDGRLRWTAPLPNAACTDTTATNKAGSTPAIAQLFSDGRAFVITGYGGIGRACGGGVAAVDGASGSLAWNLDLSAFSRRAGFRPPSHGVFSSPALADTNGDGRLEIGFGSFDQHAYLLNANGQVLWYYQLGDTTWSSGAFSDIGGGRDLEFLLGSDISGNPSIRTRDGGYLNAFRSRLRKTPGVFGFRSREILRWQTYFDQVIMSTPALGDLDPANPGLEAAILSGCVFPQTDSRKRGNWVKVLSASTGRTLRTLATASCSASSPALGDVNSDGLLDVAAAVQGDPEAGMPSRLIAWTPALDSSLWEIIPRDQRGHNEPARNTFLSPVIADLDGNGSPEVLLLNGSALGIYNGADGRTLALLPLPEVVQNTPAVADLDGSGRLSVAVAGSRLYVWSGFETLGSSSGMHPPYTAPWAMFRGDAPHTGVVGAPGL